MTANSVVQIGLYVLVLLVLAKPLGEYMARVYDNSPLWVTSLFAPIENKVYLICGVNPEQDMRWTEYAAALLWFNFFGGLVIFALQLGQAQLPLNPQQLSNVSSDSAFNTAISFVSNTNWQAYSGNVFSSKTPKNELSNPPHFYSFSFLKTPQLIKSFLIEAW